MGAETTPFVRGCQEDVTARPTHIVSQTVDPISSTPDGPLRVASAQAVAAPGDIERNVATAVRLITEASASGARLVVFPELFLCCYDLTLIGREPDRCDMAADDPRLDPIRDACRTGSLAAVVSGSIRTDGSRTISALVIDREGAVVSRYDKQHVDRSEQSLFTPGRNGCTVDIEGWRLALGICYDATFPEHARSAALAGAHGYLCPSSHRERTIVHPARAFENTMYVALSNHLGEADGRRLCGHSAIYDPEGKLLADAGPSEEGLALGDFDPDVLEEVRARSPMLLEASALGG
jgi:predicted amidohydrolase